MAILSNAERLEEIKGKQDLFIGYDERMTDKYWLIARVEELEANLTGTTRVLDETIVSLIKMGNENSRLREALAYYSNEKHYQDYDEWSPGTSDVMSDHGRKAKSALEETK